MSLYHEASDVLNAAIKNGGSIKSIVFGRKNWKSDPKTLFALATETAKWSDVLSEVIERSDVLKIEKQLTPEISLLLTHDLLLAKKGISLPHKHGLSAAIIRHKARLTAELTKLRLQRGFPSFDGLRESVNAGAQSQVEHNGFPKYNHPRWIRINTICTSLDEELNSTFAAYQRTQKLSDITSGQSKGKTFFVDENIPNLVAVASEVDLTGTAAYTSGKIILQEKASCFPAYLLDPGVLNGDIIDACAAPGNKTTHLAALVASSGTTDLSKRKVIACERDSSRSDTLAKMVKIAGATDIVRIKPKQDFLRLDPLSQELMSVTAILLDPSCSGSGIVGRDEATLNVRLPKAGDSNDAKTHSRKRKRSGDTTPSQSQPSRTLEVEAEEVPAELKDGDPKFEARLSALSAFQLRLLEHAMSFPNARRIIYSTCSLHKEENEQVVVEALLSDVAVKRKWRILRRGEQVEGLRKWNRRGDVQGVSDMLAKKPQEDTRFEIQDIADACIRCDKAGEDGTMGFFVAGFVRDSGRINVEPNGISKSNNTADLTIEYGADEEWNGFSDDE